MFVFSLKLVFIQTKACVHFHYNLFFLISGVVRFKHFEYTRYDFFLFPTPLTGVLPPCHCNGIAGASTTLGGSVSLAHNTT